MAATPVLSRDNHIVLLELYHWGHHKCTIEILCSYWLQHYEGGQLTVAITSRFVEVHPQLCEWIRSHSDRGLRLHVLSLEVGVQTGWKKLVAADRLHRLAIAQAVLLQPSHIVCLYFDHCQGAIGSLKTPAHLSISGIYFRAAFHYPTTTWKDVVVNWRKRLIVRRALKNPHLKHLFCLDDEAVAPINAIARRPIASFIPDGTIFDKADLSAEQLRTEVGVLPEQRMLLLIGSIEERKGIFQTIDAFNLLPDPVSESTVLVIVGKADTGTKRAIQTDIDSSSRRDKIVLIDEFIPDRRMTSFIEACDVLLAPYIRHFGSSGILIRAARAQKAVVGSNFGMMGRTIVQKKLGIATDSESARAIATAVESILTNPTDYFDPESALAFGLSNDAPLFAKTLLDRVTAS